MQWTAPFRFHPAIPTLFLATGLSIVACRGGGRPTFPDPGRESAAAPEISAVQVVAGELTTGETVQVSAVVSNLVTRWDWDFGTGAIPQESNDAEPSVQLLAVGRHTGQVWATNGFGTSEPFAFPYSIAPAAAPKLGPVFPDGRWMSSGSLTRFSLPILPAGGRPADYEWNLLGGVIDGPSNNSIVAFRANQPGIYTSFAIARNQHGQDSQRTTYTILQPPTVASVEEDFTDDLSNGAHALRATLGVPFTSPWSPRLEWQFMQPALNVTQSFKQGHETRSPTVQTNEASRLQGTVRACEFDWNCSQPMAFDIPIGPPVLPPALVQSAVTAPQPRLILYSSLALLDGIPMVVFDTRESGELTRIFFSQALSPEPESISGWTTYELFPDPDRRRVAKVQLTTRNGHPFFTYANQSKKLVLAEASSSRPAGPAEWSQAAVSLFYQGQHDRDLMVASDGVVWGCITISSGVTVRSLPSQEPIDSTAWQDQTFGNEFAYGDLRIVEFQGKPVIGAESRNDYVILAARDSAPNASADWVKYEIPISHEPYDSLLLRDFQSTGERLYLVTSRRVIYRDFMDCLMTDQPLEGAGAWQMIAGARVTENYYHRHADLCEWRGRLLQVGGIYAFPGPLTIVLSRGQQSVPASPDDWDLSSYFGAIEPALNGATATSPTHLYILSLDDDRAPILSWTTDDF